MLCALCAVVLASAAASAQSYPSKPVHIIVPFLGFGSSTRLAQYPDVPTLAESGLPGYEAGSWYGLAAPKGTPAGIIDMLNAQTRRIFDDPTFRDRFLAPSFIFSIVSSPQAFAERIRLESAKWGQIIRDAGVKVE